MKDKEGVLGYLVFGLLGGSIGVLMVMAGTEVMDGKYYRGMGSLVVALTLVTGVFMYAGVFGAKKDGGVK